MFPYGYTTTRVEVWENEKSKWEHEFAGGMFPRYSVEFSKPSTSVSIAYMRTQEQMFSISFIK